MKDTTLAAVLLLALLSISTFGLLRHSVRGAEAQTLLSSSPASSPVPVPDAGGEGEAVVRAEESPRDALAEEIARLLGTFTPSWSDHEERGHLEARRAEIASQVAEACRAEWPQASRECAVTLAFVGQRESRFALAIQKLGSQDNGQAHGSWQVHAWRGENPYLARTAAEMLREAPESWALPRGGKPWEGIPKAAEYLRRHP